MEDQELKEQIQQELIAQMENTEGADWTQFGMILSVMQAMLAPARKQMSQLSTADLMGSPSLMREWAVLQNMVTALEHIQAAVELIQEEENSK